MISNQHPQFWMQAYADAHAAMEKSKKNLKREKEKSKGNMTLKEWNEKNKQEKKK